MKVLVTGARGMLGSQVCSALALRHEVRGVDLQDFDITDAGAVRAALASNRPQFVVHCAAWTDVDGCERDPAKAFLHNAQGTSHVAAACAEMGAKLAYISTDFVFDGENGEPYTEFDQPNPLGVYAASKLAGEEAVRRLAREHYIVRSAWLYGPSGKNFVNTILAAAAGRDELKVVADQFGSPTYSRDLAKVMADAMVAGRVMPGTYHAVNSGVCSWAELAAEALQIRGSGTRVVPIQESEWPSPTKRPAYSALRSRWLEFQGVPPLRDWKAALRSYLTGGG
ncbi:MAG: dTDP-4-dehydrorhamnose reductase [Armatimonadota bacterium]|jgi:dTDP-4-dehydrorhamnose reductase